MIEDTDSSPSVYALPSSATFPASTVTGQHANKRPLTNDIVGIVSRLSSGPLEIPALGMEPCDSVTSAIETRLCSPYASALSLAGVPALLHADRPLELELAAVQPGAGGDTAESVAIWISAHACLAIAVEESGQPRGHVSLLVKARPSGGGWIARALVRPAAWADAASVTVVTLSLAGRPLPCDCLPATLRVGYNHTPAPAGAVLKAAQAGNVRSLQAALDAGGSTEEAGEERGGGRGRSHKGEMGGCKSLQDRNTFSSAAERLYCSRLGRRRRPL